MMNVDELEEKIKKEKTNLATLEEVYEKETDETKATKLEYRISRKDEEIEKLIERQNSLLDKEAKDGENDNSKDKDKEEEEEEDKYVCEECGGDLVVVSKDDKDMDILECEVCGELYLDEEEKKG